MADKKYKLIAFDIDGTILDNNHQLCERLIPVVARLKEDGYLFTLVSARVPLSVLDMASKLGIDNHIIALNGSFITNHKHEILYSKTFALNRVEKVLATVDKSISRSYYNQFEWILEHINDYTRFEMHILRDITRPLNKVIPDAINKITLIGDHDLLAQTKAVLELDKSLLVAFSHTNYIEITCSSISKFHGLENYARTLNLEPEQIIAFGDGENDMHMLSSVGLGVAMGNAQAHIKKVAKAVAGNNYEQGVARYLEELFGLS